MPHLQTPLLSLALTYSEPLVRRAVRARVWQRARWFLLLTPLLLALAHISDLPALNEMSWKDIQVMVGWDSFFILTVAGIFWIAYRRAVRMTLQNIKQWKSSTQTFEADEEWVRFESSAGSMEFQWVAIKEVWFFSDFWMLFFQNKTYLLFPLKDLDEAAKTFILAHTPQARQKNFARRKIQKAAEKR